MRVGIGLRVAGSRLLMRHDHFWIAFARLAMLGETNENLPAWVRKHNARNRVRDSLSVVE